MAASFQTGQEEVMNDAVYECRREFEESLGTETGECVGGVACVERLIG